MKAEMRRILLIIDNCSSHNCVPRHLEHVKVLFLLPKYYLDFAAAGPGDNSRSEAALPSSCGLAYAV